MNRALLLIAAAMAMISAPAFGQPSSELSNRRGALPLGREITNPDWVTRPTGQMLSAAFPPLGMALEISGAVTLQCSVKANGEVEDCRAVSETPAGIGFAYGALSLAPYFRMKPQMVDGVAISGAKVSIPITFAMDPDTAVDTAAPTIPPWSPRTAALAQRISRALGQDEIGALSRQATLSQIKSFSVPQMGSDVPTAESLKAIAALEHAMRVVDQKMLEANIRRIVGSMTEQEMETTATFLERPEGQKLAKGIASPPDVEARQAIFDQMTKEARSKFCAEVACVVERKPSQ